METMASAASSKDIAALKEEHTKARTDVIQSEQEIQSIKVALRTLAAGKETDQAESTLEVCLLKVDGLPAEAKPKFALQLSSPIEEATLSKLFDPLSTKNEEIPKEALAKFQGVDTSVAMLTIAASDADIPLGTSISYEVADMCGSSAPIKKASDVKDKYAADVPVAILDAESAKKAEDSNEANEGESKAVEEEKETLVETNAEDAETDKSKEEAKATDESAPETAESKPVEKADDEAATKADDTTASPTAIVTPICTVTLRVTYTPSPKDKQEKLYELLNAVSQKKAKAIEVLRKVSSALAQQSGPAGSATAASGKPAVKPGFLSRGSRGVTAKEKKSKMQQFQERYFGPQSLLMKTAGVMIFARNYIIFFGAATFFHFKGHMLALPPPV